MRDGLKKNGMDAAGMLASIYGTKVPTDAVANTNTNKETKNSVTNIGGPGVIDLQAGATPKVSLDLGGGSTSEKIELNTNGAKTTAQALNDFDLKNNDITTDKGSSIFEVISNRYQQSGYPRLFKLKEPASDPVKK